MKSYYDEFIKYKKDNLAEFSLKLIPNCEKKIIGITCPNIRKFSKNVDFEFLNNLPHKYHEEDILHAYMLSNLKVDFDQMILEVEKFLPYITNWSVNDSMCKNIKCFKSNRKKLLDKTLEWCQTNKTYYIRLALLVQMSYLISDEYIEEIIFNIYSITNHDYYVDMMIAWLLATVMIKYEKEVIDILKSDFLNTFIKRKTISKAIESFRIKESTKEDLRNFRKLLFK